MQNSSRWIAVAALWAGLAVGLGAFGAHLLKDGLVESGHLDTWHTAVRYQMWHALAILAVVLLAERRPSLGGAPAWFFLVGSLLFSGSLYGLSLGGPPAVLGPLTPLGGATLITGWLLFAQKAAFGGGAPD